MKDNVVKFEPVVVGADYRFDPDEILEAAKGNKFQMVAVLAINEDGSMWISGSANAGEIMILMEKAKIYIISDDE